MALTAAQTAAKNFLTTSSASYLDPVNNKTQTVAQWYGSGADNVVIDIMNSTALGATLNLIAKVHEFNHAAIKEAIMESSDFDTMKAAPGVLTALQWAITENPVPRTTLISAGNRIMGTAYANAKAAVVALLTAPATPWQFASDNTGVASFTQTDLSAIRAS